MKNFLLLIFLMNILSCQNHTKDIDKEKYEQSKQRLADNEKNNPLTFLKIFGKDHKNIFGKTVTKAEINNTATICSYKDVRVKMLSFDKAGMMIEEHEDIIPDEIKPASTFDFKTKYRLPQTVDSIALSIMSATPLIDSAKNNQSMN
jgi:hypothetical protein